jgi:outer membrane protein OmpA-like peptidoglycan-associated protein
VVLAGKHENKANLDVTTDYQAFGLMVTAEPHFAVSRPSNIVVLQNIARPEPIICDPCAPAGGVAYTTDKSGIQTADSQKSDVVRAGDDIVDKSEDVLSKGGDVIKKGVDAVPGVHIDSSSSNSTSTRTYTDSNQYGIDWSSRSSVAQARNAVRLATAAGAPTYAPDILAKANRLLAEAEGNGGSFTRTDSLAREAAQTAEDARIMSQRGMALAEIRARQQQQEALLKAEKARLKAEQDLARAERGVIVGEAVALAETERALMKSEEEKAALRAKLAAQLNAIMTTRDTVRGLIVDMADVRFDTGKYQLRTTDKEKLAKVSGILLSYPGLTLEVEGFTDNTGTEPFNQKLSEQRAQAVRDYLISQGIPSARVTAKGLGETMPVASNDTPAGRQQNRRVELIVSGDAIGTTPNGTVQ